MKKVIVDKYTKVDYYLLCPVCNNISRPKEDDFYEHQDDDDRFIEIVECDVCHAELEVETIRERK